MGVVSPGLVSSCPVLLSHVVESWKSTYAHNLWLLPEPLPKTGVLANYSFDFSLAKRTASQPAGHTNRPVYGGPTTT